MDTNQLERSICRVCLEDSLCLDWNTVLYQFDETTYKDCYYKYSQLEQYSNDPFPQMLCQNCSIALESTHALILKALESDKLLQERLTYDSDTEEEFLNSTSNSQFDYVNEFETVLVETIEIEPVLDGNFKSEENSDEEFVLPFNNVSKEPEQQTKPSVKAYENMNVKIKHEEPLKEPVNNSSVNDNKSKIIVKRQPNNKVISFESDFNENDLMDGNEIKEEGQNARVKPKVKRKYNKEKNKPRMCSICSKILHNQHAVKMHEKTHMDNRERKETCKVCGLKFYNKKILYSHMLIHKENREKRHQCEFCTKAFYDKGSLNVHRRIHLGQMAQCCICSKQYYRQVDLDRHMSSHSATAINSDVKKRSRYLVRCQYCDKSILSTSFKSHTAAHLNEPLMRCLVCGKEYFRRESCVIHVKKVHQKSNDEYNDFIEIFKKNRLSHLFLEQKADMQVNSI